MEGLQDADGVGEVLEEGEGVLEGVAVGGEDGETVGDGDLDADKEGERVGEGEPDGVGVNDGVLEGVGLGEADGDAKQAIRQELGREGSPVMGPYVCERLAGGQGVEIMILTRVHRVNAQNARGVRAPSREGTYRQHHIRSEYHVGCFRELSPYQ